MKSKTYNLVNKTTLEQICCSKVTIEGFDYYVSDEIIKDVRLHKGKWHIEKDNILNQFPDYLTDLSECKLIIATNNPNIDLPQVIDEIEELANKSWRVSSSSLNLGKLEKVYWVGGFQHGYNKAQETQPFSKDDMIAFGKKCFYKGYDKAENDDANCFTAWREEAKELLELWKEQQTKTIYYGTI